MERSSAILQRFVVVLFFALLVPSLPAQTFSVLHYFTNAEGFYPVGGLIADGNVLFGTTRVSVFRVNTDGSGYTVLKNFTNSADGFGLNAPLILDGTTLYGNAGQGGSNLLGTVFKLNTDGTGYAILNNFTGAPDGRLQADDGLILSGTTLYGTTSGGGSNNFGTVFKINTDGGGYLILKNFEGSPDGAGPRGRLCLDGDTLYGATIAGGSNACCRGTIFRINTDGSGYAILRRFGASYMDPDAPYGGLILSGNTLYGTTPGGGSNNVGTVFKMKTDGVDFAILHHFPTSVSGSLPGFGVILAGDTLYGTTATVGGSDNGTVFSLKTDGSDFAVLKQFSDFANPTYATNNDGATPQAGLVANGNALYGAASTGGFYYLNNLNRGGGAVFKITLPQPLRILVSESSFGVKSNVFGFNVTGDSNQVVVVEACTNLMTFDWLPLQTNTLGAGPFYFSDPDWTNYAGRFYRVRSP